MAWFYGEAIEVRAIAASQMLALIQNAQIHAASIYFPRIYDYLTLKDEVPYIIQADLENKRSLTCTSEGLVWTENSEGTE